MCTLHWLPLSHIHTHTHIRIIILNFLERKIAAGKKWTEKATTEREKKQQPRSREEMQFSFLFLSFFRFFCPFHCALNGRQHLANTINLHYVSREPYMRPDSNELMERMRTKRNRTRKCIEINEIETHTQTNASGFPPFAFGCVYVVGHGQDGNAELMVCHSHCLPWYAFVPFRMLRVAYIFTFHWNCAK